MDPGSRNMSYPDPAKRFGSIHPSIRIHRKTFKSLRRNCQLVIFQMPAERDFVKVKIVQKKIKNIHLYFNLTAFCISLLRHQKKCCISINVPSLFLRFQQAFYDGDTVYFFISCRKAVFLDSDKLCYF